MDSVHQKYALAARVKGVAGWQLSDAAVRPVKLHSRTSHCASLAEAIDACDLRDGATIGFHHHFRNGDRVVLAVMRELARKGLRRLTVAASSIFPVHGPLVELIRSGVIDRIISDYIKGPVADEIMAGGATGLSVLQSHGGRARSIAAGELSLDAAFIGASLAHISGAATGRGGNLPCGPLGYAMVDAKYARRTVILADQITDKPLTLIDIPADHVDFLVRFEQPGDPDGIRSGATVPRLSETANRISDAIGQVLDASGVIQDGFSFQTGAGGYSLAAVATIGDRLARKGIRADFISGGITAAHVALLEGGIAARIRDVQSFDLEAVRSSICNMSHMAMSAEEYASPSHPAPAVNDLTVMLLGAGEVDLDFNVNVTLGGDGKLIGGPGGHPDAASGAKLSIVTTALTGGGFSKMVEAVSCVTTPGDSIDVVVTDAGIIVNPRRQDLLQRFKAANLHLLVMEEAIALSRSLASRVRTQASGKPVIVIESRDGGALDAVLCSP